MSRFGPTRRWALPRGRWWLLGASTLLVSAAIALAVSWSGTPDPTATRRAPAHGAAPGFELPDLRDNDRTVTLADFAGRPLVVNFFASWCAPCRREMPAFDAVYERVTPRVAFVGIDNRDIRSDGRALVRETKVSYPVGFDPRGEVAAAFGVLGMPTTVFVSADGVLLERVTGEMSEEQLAETLERLFPRQVRG